MEINFGNGYDRKIGFFIVLFDGVYVFLWIIYVVGIYYVGFKGDYGEMVVVLI